MVRARRKKSLYEVIGKTHSKPGYDKTLEQPTPGKAGKDEPITTRILETVAKWPRRPRIIQFNAGRLELSMSYQLAIALLLGIILLLLVVFRLGQTSNLSRQKAADSATRAPESARAAALRVTGSETQTTDSARKTMLNAQKTMSAEPKGSNRIVIQSYELRAHLEPVRRYFAENGIETEIRRIGGTYYLVTEGKYENPERPGTNGYLAKQKIIEMGAKYKAPPGRETFGSKPFHDAYGMRFDD